MPSYPDWKFVLRSAISGTEIGELTQARNRSLSLTLNRPGTASFTLPMDDVLASAIQPLTTGLNIYRTTPSNIGTGSPFIWSGYVQTIDENISDNTMTVNVIDWFERLNKRMTRTKLTFTDVDDGFIIQELLAHANLTTNAGYSVPIPTGAVPAAPTLISGQHYPKNEAVWPDAAGGTTTYAPLTGAARRNKVLEPYTMIGPEIIGLTELENACDIYMTPAQQIWIYRKRQSDRKNAVFGFNWGPNNVKQLGRQFDSSSIVNYMLVTSRPEVAPRFQDHLASQAAYGLIEESFAMPGESDLTGSLLQYYAAAEVALRNQPRQIFSVTPFPYTVGSSVPEPFIDYNVGDKVYLSARWGQRINIAGLAMRVFGMSFQIDENGNENPGPLQLSPQG